MPSQLQGKDSTEPHFLFDPLRIMDVISHVCPSDPLAVYLSVHLSHVAKTLTKDITSIFFAIGTIDFYHFVPLD